jgi:serine/threonine protein kinase
MMTTTADYCVGPVLGEGSFGRVFLCVHKETKREVAVKVVDKVSMQKNSGYLQSLLMEQRIMKSLRDCEFVARLFASFHDENCCYMVLELVHGGSLADLMRQRCKQQATGTSLNRCFVKHFKFIHVHLAKPLSLLA